jgi:uncharacterized protein
MVKSHVVFRGCLKKMGSAKIASASSLAGAKLLGRTLAILLIGFAASFVYAQPPIPIPPPQASGGGPVSDLPGDLEAAKRGDKLARLRVAKFYDSREGGRNYTEAFRWFQAASSEGVKEATAWLGSYYLYGHGVTEDKTKGLALIQSAATAGDAVGLRFLGLMYEGGNGVPKNYTRAFRMLSQAVEKGDVKSYDRLAHLYLTGNGAPHDVAKAMSLMQEGSRLGEPWAQMHLANLYEHGDSSAGIPPNPAKAMELYHQAAAQGNSAAAFELAHIYKTGEGIEIDDKLALQFLRQAARGGYVPAQIEMGDWQKSQGGPENLAYAFAWYSLAAGQGSIKANEKLVLLQEQLNPEQKQQGETILKSWSSHLDKDKSEAHPSLP